MKSESNVKVYSVNTLEKKAALWWNNLEVQVKVAFLCTILWGIIGHGSAMFNKFSVHDDVAFTHSVGLTVTLGRWMLELVSRFEQLVTASQHYSMPLVNGMVTIVCIAVTVSILVALFRIRSVALSIAIGGILVVNPAVTSTLGYMFTAPYYAVSLLMTVWGASLLCKYRTWYAYAIAVVCFICGLGIYQAYIPAAISILLIHFILETYEAEDVNWKKFFRTAVYYVSAIMVSVLCYYILNKFFVRYFNEELSSYQGVNKMGRESISTYLSRLLLVVQAFLVPEEIDAGMLYVVMGLKTPYKILLAMTAVMSGILIFRGYRQSVLKGLLLTGACLLMPLAVHFIYVMCPDVRELMAYGSYYFFVFAACIADRMMEDKKQLIRVICIACCLILLLFCFLYCRYDNALYMHVAFDQERTMNYFNVLIAQIKSTEGYRDELPVAYINFTEKEDHAFRDLTQFPLVVPYEKSTELINDAAAKHFMHKWCGFSPSEVTFEHPDIADMPCYPDEGSIRVIDDVVVVKFG